MDKIEKALKNDSISNSVSDIGDIKAKDMNKVENITINKSLIFSFVALQMLPALHNNHIINRKSITSTKFSENLNFFKRSINNLFFTFELIIKKKILETQNNIFLIKIRSKFDLLLNIMESQMLYILALEMQIEEFIF